MTIKKLRRAASEFFGATGQEPTCGPSLERLRKNAETTRSTMEKFASQLMRYGIGIKGEDVMGPQRFSMGNIKGAEQTSRKVYSQFDGDSRKVSDPCRSQIYTHSPKELEKLLKFLEKEYDYTEENFHHRGDRTPGRRSQKAGLWNNVEVRTDNGEIKRFKDHITNPKRWGWMGLTLHLETKLNNNEWGKFEIQVFPEGMRDAYDATHAAYEEIRTDIERWEQACEDAKEYGLSGDIPIEEFFANEPKILNTLNLIINLHKSAGEQCGLHKLRQKLGGPDFPSLNTASPKQEGDDEVEPIEGYKVGPPKPEPKPEKDIEVPKNLPFDATLQ